jgi:acyl transferase domain-containing protein
MFSGQGAQYFGMGRPLYSRNSVFRSCMNRLDAIAADYVGQSVVEVLYGEGHTKSQAFDHILHTHPALFMVQVAMAETLRAEGFTEPTYLFGASLGEFVAASVAGVADAEIMLFDVIKQARLFESHCAGGAMLMVIDAPVTFETDPIFAGCELAGVNFDRCFVISGARGDILRVADALKARDVIHQLLPVAMAFHSSRIESVENTFLHGFAARRFAPPRIPVLSCANIPDKAAAFSAAYWWQVIRRPIDFQKSLLAFARRHPQAIYVDLGPSGTMATFAKYNLPTEAHERIMPIMTPFGRDDEALENVRGRLCALSSGRP